MGVNGATGFTLQLQGLLLELTTPRLSQVAPSAGGEQNVITDHNNPQRHVQLQPGATVLTLSQFFPSLH